MRSISTIRKSDQSYRMPGPSQTGTPSSPALLPVGVGRINADLDVPLPESARACQGAPAVDLISPAGYPASFLRGKIEYQLRDLLWIADPTDRMGAL
jgi:hypothetical protein